MLARVYSCAVIGLEGVVVEVEVDTGDGLPSTVIVGTKDHKIPHLIGRRVILQGEVDYIM